MKIYNTELTLALWVGTFHKIVWNRKRNSMKKSLIIFALIAVLISACSASAPATAPARTQVVEPTATAIPPTATAIPSPLPPSATPAPTATATPAVSLFPDVTFSANTVCRMGPDKNYYSVITYSAGKTTQVQGRSDDGNWLNVMTQAPNKPFTCWVPVESVKGVANAPDLRVVTAAPLPTGATRAIARQRPICGVNKSNGAVVIDWTPYAEGTGFIIYRNGKNLTTVYDHEYIDHDTPGSKKAYTLTYDIQAFNAVGLAKVSASVSVTICG